jgi:hypothetical protein
LRSNTKGYGEKKKLTRLTHQIAVQLHLVAESCTMYHLQFSLQSASPETFGYTLVYRRLPWCYFMI